jgi:hypothetical protein
VFYLNKTGDIWTLAYEVGPLRRALLIGAGVAGLVVAIFQGVTAGFDRSTLATVGGVLVSLGLMAYWMLSDAASSAVFDLAQRHVNVHCDRPWFGPPRTYSFSDVVSLRAVNRSGESSDSWEAVLELREFAWAERPKVTTSGSAPIWKRSEEPRESQDHNADQPFSDRVCRCRGGFFDFKNRATVSKGPPQHRSQLSLRP